MSTSAMRRLLAAAIDYAGLFPPASLPMGEAVRNYAAYRKSAHAWALGRFVVPIARLEEFYGVADAFLHPTGEGRWRLAALAGAAGAADWNRVRRDDGACVVVDTFELRARTPDEVAAAAARLPTGLNVFYEIPIEADPTPLVAAIGRVGGRAKVRTGGVTPDAFPSAADLARFILACERAAVPFKATAGLHHPFRASYRLTYAPDSPRGEMFGFVNVLTAAALARTGAAQEDVAALLGERDPRAIRFAAGSATWRDRVVSADELAQTRATLALSFGSCSFREPIDELEALGFL